MDSPAYGRSGAALTVHRTVIHFRPSNPLNLLTNKKTGFAGPFVGGRGWIRTIVVCDNGFTVRSLWPLGNPSVFIFNDDIIHDFVRLSTYIICRFNIAISKSNIVD